ncbi:type II toxin-antitoxin system PemK/MazF family toxin [Methylotuvimicrobium buryatense]|uniref:MazF family transcriptional regulator n=1 Tax=Methylotuvimicrobium buryatense TaxID=95641 RepID=A0A4P9ULV1_METBY|nr:type II toxin-antitoxin system PemK/MazF family toxin [Methylotuvimicrobium buryatense]QCW82107.1 MazF family transcriptional regulator [Methylotuvimicrobium buryatense]
MGALTTGQVVVLPFPFSDLTQNKSRPALLLANAERGDWVACQITSRAYTDIRAIEINNDNFIDGSLHCVSYARVGKLFTAHESLFSGIVGKLGEEKLNEIKSAVISLLQNTNDTSL